MGARWAENVEKLRFLLLLIILSLSGKVGKMREERRRDGGGGGGGSDSGYSQTRE